MGTTEGKPFTIAELAAKAKASERYVREWLGVLVCAKVVELHGESAASDEQQRFVFPPEHAVALTTMGGPSNMSVYCDEWAMLAKASYDLLCTHMLDGQGIAYEPFAKQGGWNLPGRWRGNDSKPMPFLSSASRSHSPC